MKTYLLVSSIALLASCACFASANADTTVCLVEPAPGSPCVPRLKWDPPMPRPRTEMPPRVNVKVGSQNGTTTQFPGRDRTIEIPSMAQVGRQVQITGPFDGDPNNTRVKAAGGVITPNTQPPPNDVPPKPLTPDEKALIERCLNGPFIPGGADMHMCPDYR
jgi:hypothetical protein